MKPVVPKDELNLRISRACEMLVKEDKDALLIPLGIYFNYFFGKQGIPSERIIAGVIPKDEESFVLCPTFEMDNIRTRTYIDDIVGWDETSSPYQILNQEIKDRNIGSKLLVDPKLWVLEKENIEKSGITKLTSGHFQLSKLRSTKTEWETTQLQAAAKSSAEGIMAAIPHLSEGISEIDFIPFLNQELGQRSGNPLSFGIVQFGENSAIPHGSPTNRKLRNNEVVLIDAGTSINGYHGDITITVPFGDPKGFEDIYEIVYNANRSAFNSDKKGSIPSELDSIARDYITEKGYGQYFTHRLGHGLGMEVHEDPYIVGNNMVPLTEGNCHTIEPGIYIPGKFGVRIEDDVIVRKNKAELLFETPRHNF